MHLLIIYSYGGLSIFNVPSLSKQEPAMLCFLVYTSSTEVQQILSYIAIEITGLKELLVTLET